MIQVLIKSARIIDLRFREACKSDCQQDQNRTALFRPKIVEGTPSWNDLGSDFGDHGDIDLVCIVGLMGIHREPGNSCMEWPTLEFDGTVLKASEGRYGRMSNVMTINRRRTSDG